jgi:hypothetical protein
LGNERGPDSRALWELGVGTAAQTADHSDQILEAAVNRLGKAQRLIGAQTIIAQAPPITTEVPTPIRRVIGEVRRVNGCYPIKRGLSKRRKVADGTVIGPIGRFGVRKES